MQKYAEEAAIQQMEVLQQRFKQHWGNTNPWQDERHQEIPNFIEDLAKKDVYKRQFLHVLTTGKGSLNQACRLFYYLKI